VAFVNDRSAPGKGRCLHNPQATQHTKKHALTGFEILILANKRMQTALARVWTIKRIQIYSISVLTSILVLSVVGLLQCLCIKWYGDIVHTAFTERVFRNSTPEIEKLFYKTFGTQWSLKLYGLVSIKDVVTTQT
jgi:hypothetical protein